MPAGRARKRARDPSPSSGAGTSLQGSKKSRTLTVPSRKATLFDSLDSVSTPGTSANTRSLTDFISSVDDESSLSSLSDADFQDIATSLGKGKQRESGRDDKPSDDDDNNHDDGGGDGKDDDGYSEDDEDIEFEDVQVPLASLAADQSPSETLNLTFNLYKDTRVSLINNFGKKGPTKRDRLTRNGVHRMHVQCLMWANAIRNSWLCDPEVQGTLISHLPSRVWDEYERWKRVSGLEPHHPEPGGRPAKAKGKAKSSATSHRASRDWGNAAQRLEPGAVDLSQGDPLFRFMKTLSAWWKQRFRTTAPGIRKVGYMSLERLDRLTRAFKEGEHDPSKYGERIRDLDEFRQHAQDCTGSRDVGAQLFTALLRGLGLEARMVASLQPLGFGWTKLEDADPEDEADLCDGDSSTARLLPRSGRDVSNAKQTSTSLALAVTEIKLASSQTSRGTGRRTEPDKADAGDTELREINSDDDMVVEIPQKAARAPKQFDKDLEYPHYWSEVLSPVTKQYVVVDPIVKSMVATNRELVESLEPRGSKAEKARQVIAYVVGFSQDGTAKDVTVRYLKRHVLPGRTKGMRYPLTKVPVYNKDGKIKHHDLADWTKSVMRGYSRGTKEHPITEADQLEDSTDLRPAKHEKKLVKVGEETLQYYKQSKEYVLERHLKREEALIPAASPVSVFRSKGKGGKATEENVYFRKDVVHVKSVETWHKQGRAPKQGERPLKIVPYRAATINKKREIAMAESASGQKVLQGLYSFDQTDWIIPPPIKDGVIPKNEYGNIDLFVDHMLPQGAVHLSYRGVVKVCRRLGIDYAEAVVDFEFGSRMAVPVIQGVVVAEEYGDRVMRELAKEEAERARKEDEKRRKAALSMWRRMLMGMRILQKLRDEYGDLGGDMPVFRGSNSLNESNRQPSPQVATEEVYDEETAGGFTLDEEALVVADVRDDEGEAQQGTSYFPVLDEDEGEDADDALLVEDTRADSVSARTDGLDPQHFADSQRSLRNRSSRRAASEAASKIRHGDLESDSCAGPG